MKEGFANKKNALLVGVAAIAMTAVSLFVATFITFKYQDYEYKRAKLAIQKESIENTLYGTRYQEIREKITSFNNEVNALTAIDNSLFSMPSALQAVQNLIPKDVTISAMNYHDTDLSFEINGIAATRDKLLETQSNFENAEFITEVIAPISNYDTKKDISFLMKIKLDFAKLKPYGIYTNTK